MPTRPLCSRILPPGKILADTPNLRNSPASSSARYFQNFKKMSTMHCGSAILLKTEGPSSISLSPTLTLLEPNQNISKPITRARTSVSSTMHVLSTRWRTDWHAQGIRHGQNQWSSQSTCQRTSVRPTNSFQLQWKRKSLQVPLKPGTMSSNSSSVRDTASPVPKALSLLKIRQGRNTGCGESSLSRDTQSKPPTLRTFQTCSRPTLKGSGSVTSKDWRSEGRALRNDIHASTTRNGNIHNFNNHLNPKP